MQPPGMAGAQHSRGWRVGAFPIWAEPPSLPPGHLTASCFGEEGRLGAFASIGRPASGPPLGDQPTTSADPAGNCINDVSTPRARISCAPKAEAVNSRMQNQYLTLLADGAGKPMPQSRAFGQRCCADAPGEFWLALSGPASADIFLARDSFADRPARSQCDMGR